MTPAQGRAPGRAPRRLLGETLTRLRWAGWVEGEAQGDPDALIVPAVVLVSSYPDAAAAVGRPGLVVPRFDGYCRDVELDLRPADLLERVDGTVLEVTGPPARHVNALSGRAHVVVVPCTEHVDTGPETVQVFGSVEVVDSYGDDHQRVPDTVGVLVDRVTVEAAAGPETADGQSAPREWRISGRGLGVLDAWSTVEWPAGSGRMHDVIGAPVRHPWPRAHAHTRATIRERR